MTSLKGNIWALFIFLLASSFLAFVIAHIQEWKSVHQDYEDRQVNLVNLIADAANSLFFTQEMMLDVVGREAYENKSHHILDNTLAINPSYIAFGLVSAEGIPLYYSSNLDYANAPDLPTNPKTRESFFYALGKDKMVLGRTYFMQAYGEWGIPIRRTIFNEQGDVVGLMTAGLRLKGTARIFDQPLHWGKYHEVMLIRDFDNYVQYYSGDKNNFDTIYNHPVERALLNQLFEGIVAKYNCSLDDLKAAEKPHVLILKVKGETKQFVLRYDRYFELWTVSSIQGTKIHAVFLKTLKINALIFVVVLAIIALLFRSIAQAEAKRRSDLIFQATHDPLTQLPNRRYLQEKIDNWIYPGAQPFSILYLDMDGFKKINDSYGHRFGDQVLIDMAFRLKRIVPESSIVVRQEGDEFVILSYGDDDKELKKHAEGIIDELSRPYTIDQLSFIIGVSVGIAKYPQHGSDLDKLLRSADIAMYEAKKQKNNVCHYNLSMLDRYLEDVALEQALRQALDKKQLYMVYQPQIDNSGRAYGVESLIRWEDENLGFVPPDKFIAVAESSGLMIKLGLFILQTSLREMSTLQKALGITYQTSINISVKQFMEADFLGTLKEEIDRSGLPHDSLCLEITESLFIEDVDYILPLLGELHDLGLRISMDDFGTGYSSLSMLNTLPIDELKIDRSFMTSMVNDDSSTPMIRNIIAIGKNLDLDVLAEGVESQQQEELLKVFGCDQFQGYYYARPMKYDQLLEFFRGKEAAGKPALTLV